MKEIGRNVNIAREKNKLQITIDLSKDFGPSKSGKTIMIATTLGGKNIGSGVCLGINCYKYPDSKGGVVEI